MVVSPDFVLSFIRSGTEATTSTVTVSANDYRGNKMRTCVCDLCKNTIDPGVSTELTIPNVGLYDFCPDCVKRVRRAICLKCKGKGRHQEVDVEASQRGASCGENRTEYRTVACQECIGSR